MSSPVFLAAPHRVMFASGTVHLVVVFALWAIELTLRAAGGGSLFAVLPSAIWHPLLMTFGFFPLFIFGFLMTALPRWVGAPALSRPAYLWPFALLVAGWLGFHAGESLGLAPLAAAGLAFAAIGWALGGWSLLGAARIDNPDKRHAYTAIGLVFAGAGCLAAAALAVAAGQPALVRVATLAALWLFLIPVFVVVSHRMLPFFSQGTIRGIPMPPMWMLWTLLGCLYAHGIATVAGELTGRSTVLLTLVPDALAAGVALHLTWRWRLLESLPNRLLATHHFAFAWLGIGLALFAVQGLASLAGIDGGRTLPIHSLGAGFLLSMVLGMATRVTLGHSGLPIQAGAWLWPAYGVLQAAIVLRLVADLLPPTAAAHLLPLSALAVGAVFGLWAFRHLGFLFRPRADGEAG